MTAQQLLDVRNGRPFEPFRLVMSDGRAYEIRHPEMLFVGEDASIIGIPSRPTEGALPNRFIRIANEHATSTIPLSVPDQHG